MLDAGAETSLCKTAEAERGRDETGGSAQVACVLGNYKYVVRRDGRSQLQPTSRLSSELQERAASFGNQDAGSIASN